MKPAETAKGHGPLRRVVYNHRMNQAGAGFVHVLEPRQSAVPFANEDAFIALVAVYGDHSEKDVAAGDVPLDHWPPRVTGLKSRLVKPHIQSCAGEAGLKPFDRVMVLVGVAYKNCRRLRDRSGVRSIG